MTVREGVKDYDDGAAMLVGLRHWLRVNMGLRYHPLYRGLVKWARLQEMLLEQHRLQDFYAEMKRIWRYQAELQPALLSLELRRLRTHARTQKKNAQQTGAQRRRADTLKRVKTLADKKLSGVPLQKQVSVLQSAWPKGRKRLSDDYLRNLLKELGWRT